MCIRDRALPGLDQGQGFEQFVERAEAAGHHHVGGRHHARFKMSCGEAKWSVRNRGYRNVSTVECNGATYTFRASRNGHRILVYVNARSGAVWRG